MLLDFPSAANAPGCRSWSGPTGSRQVGVPICGTDVYTDLTVAERVEKVAQVPLWIFHGDADEVVSVEVSRNIVKALRKAGGNPKYTEYPGVNHDRWSFAYRDPELVKWLFAQKKSNN